MKRIFITGANRGIGLELVRQYLGEDTTRIFATARQPQAAGELQALVAAHPDRLKVVPLDVTDEAAIARAVQIVAGEVEALDILINNAAINPPGIQSLAQISAETMQTTFTVNAVAPLLVARAFQGLLEKGSHPRLVNISTQVGSMTWKTSGGSYAYAASKAALNMVTRCLAADLQPAGIITIMLHPGWVQTDMGGVHAALTPAESISGIIKLINNLTTAENGKFFKWNGEPHPW
ncbi:MAG: SDR family oxidoreductase [Anaerolineaceae bacterium]|nr:SDR family oxidoreductase [Anaerolineaceae bacterium]